jgi:hypothetical protein
MKPTPEVVLNNGFAKIVFEMGPALPPGYGQGSASLVGIHLLLLAQEFNRAADVRVQENAAMRALFADVVPRFHGSLGTRLSDACKRIDSDLKISALDENNTFLKNLLIDLHAYVEKVGDRPLAQRILLLLSEFASARQVFLPAM